MTETPTIRLSRVNRVSRLRYQRIRSMHALTCYALPLVDQDGLGPKGDGPSDGIDPAYEARKSWPEYVVWSLALE